MDLALNNLQRLLCHKPKQTKPNETKFLHRVRKDSDYMHSMNYNY